MSEKKSALSKSEQTKQKILDAALQMFRELGYEKATMRKIAQRAGLAPGAAYYYFESKEHIIFQYYMRSYEEHLPAVNETFKTRKKLGERIAGAVQAHIDVAKPYHELSRALFKAAAGRRSHPLSPLSEQCAPLRARNLEIFSKLVEGSDTSLPVKLRVRLPDLLWLYKMLVILFWLYDDSPDQKKTDTLIQKSAVLIEKTVSLARLPVLRPIINRLLTLVEEFKPY